MRPTLGGCLAMNIHGKNNFRVGSIGDHVLDFDLLTTDGR
jgi:FAD/FMN-containing dehydrogenase